MATQLRQLSLVSFPDRDWDTIRQFCKGRSGVYAFICNVTNQYYIGSAVDLYNRLRDYHQPWYLTTNSGRLIIQAISEHGMHNFTIVILEFTTPENAVAAEQVWIDTYKPEYNMLPVASSSLGYVHTDQDKQKISDAMKGKPRSNEVREAMSRRQTGSGNTFFGNPMRQKHVFVSLLLLEKFHTNQVVL
jgi:group I intron endonuclease